MHLIKRTILSILLSVTLMMITPNKLSPVFNEIIIGAIYEPGEKIPKAPIHLLRIKMIKIQQFINL